MTDNVKNKPLKCIYLSFLPRLRFETSSTIRETVQENYSSTFKYYSEG